MRKVLLSFTFLFLFALGATMTQTGYKPVSNNLIINSTFDIGIQNWTTTPNAMNLCVGYPKQIRSSPAGLLKRLS
jgi:hypothetical protein